MQTVASLMVLAALVVGCETSSPDSCKVTCTTDVDCPGGQSCGELGKCTSGEACPCEAGEFRGCDGDVARFCNATADGLATESCGSGCNEGAGRCNLCVPSAATCSASGTQLDQCGADGLPALSSTCALPCVPKNATVDAHCGYLQPLFFPDVCNDLAMLADLALANVTLDTSSDATCNGGILTQAGGPEVCVLRYGTISIGENVIVRGGRAIAFVADTGVLMQGLLDASADATGSGPGRGGISGERAATNKGGGGAGFGQVGGAGGTGAAGSGTAGAVVDPLQTMVFAGGTTPTGPTVQQQSQNYPVPGGGGGAVMLVACRGDVVVGGTIDVGGGGGQGGRDSNATTAVNIVGGTGGGSGGYVVLQGINVRVTGIGETGIFANGGGGGGGCFTDNCSGMKGNDADDSTAVAPGGTSTSGLGGSGGTGSSAAQPGGPPTSGDGPGGGGGAVGRLQVCKPDVGTVTITATTSPAPLADVMIPTR